MNISYAELVSTLALGFSLWTLYLNRDKLHFDKGRAESADRSAKWQRIEDDMRTRYESTLGTSETTEVVLWALRKGLPIERVFEVAVTLSSPYHKSVAKARRSVRSMFDERVEGWRDVMKSLNIDIE